MFTKILVANRGEIAVRAFRAATELNVATVAVFPYEDRHAEYRLKADESYQIGEQGHPVRAFLDIAGIVEAAQHAGADAIYPCYGFLSENPDLAQACEAAGRRSASGTRRMPRPPPPETAFTKTGKPISSAALMSSSGSALGSEPCRVGRPASRAAAMARALLPVSSSTS